MLLILCRPSVINFLMCDLFSICVSIYNIRNLEFFLNFDNFSVINCEIRNLKIWKLKTIELEIYNVKILKLY